MTSKEGKPIASDITSRALAIGRTALEKNAADVVILNVGPLTSIADYLVICSGNSERQVKAIARAVDEQLSRLFSVHASIEGEASATWILLDYGDIIVHVFREDIRDRYGIEKMWRDAEQIPTSEFESPSPVSHPRIQSHQMTGTPH